MGHPLLVAEPLKNVIISLSKDIGTNFDKMFNDVAHILSLDVDWSMAGTISDGISKFALQIAGICLLIELAQVASKVDLLKWEHGLKVCVKMALTVVFINHVPDLLRAFFYQGVELIGIVGGTPIGKAFWEMESRGFWESNSVQGWTNNPDAPDFNPAVRIATATGLSPTTTGLGTIINRDIAIAVSALSDTWDALALFMAVLVLVLAVWACGIIVKVIAYFRLFELTIYVAISPLPCAFFPLGNGDGGGFSRITAKFLRSFAAVCLQGMMIILCLQVFNGVVGGTLEGAATKIVMAMDDDNNKEEKEVKDSKIKTTWSKLMRKQLNGLLDEDDQKELDKLNANYRFVIDLPDSNTFPDDDRPDWVLAYESKLKSEFVLPHVSQMCFIMLIGSVVMLMSVMKCGSWAKSILDAV